MESKNLRDIKPNPKNPRKIADPQLNALVESLRHFGDLSGVVENETTGHLVGAHQRLKAFGRLGGEHKVIIDHRYEAPNRVGTVAIGHFEHDGEIYGYRAVQWELATEIAANKAANGIQGYDDLELLSEANQYLIENDHMDLLALSGQSEEDVLALQKASGIADNEQDGAPKEPPMIIRIECDNDQQMTDLFAELKERGLKVKVA